MGALLIRLFCLKVGSTSSTKKWHFFGIETFKQWSFRSQIYFENGWHIILIEFGRDLNNEISKVLISVVQPLDDIYGSFNDQGTPLPLLQ